MTLEELQVILTVNIAQVLPQVMEARKAFGTLTGAADEAGTGMDKAMSKSSSNTEKSLDNQNRAEEKSAQATQKAVRAKTQSLEEITAIANRAADRYTQSISGMSEAEANARTYAAVRPSRMASDNQQPATAQSTQPVSDTSHMDKIRETAQRVRKSLSNMFSGASSGASESQHAFDTMAAKLDNINARAYVLQKRLDSMRASYSKVAEQSGSESPGALKLQGQILSAENRLATLAAQSDKTAAALEDLKTSETETGNAAQQLGRKTEETGKRTRAAASSSSGFERALNRIQSQIFRNLIVYGLLIKGLSSLGSYMWNALKTNTAFSNSLNNLKVQLLTAFYPIYQAALPALTSLINALARAMTYVAAFLSGFFGKTYAESVKGASGLNKQVKALQDTGKAAQDAKKSLSGFDEINTLSKQTTSSDKATGADAALANTDFSAPSSKPLISESQIAAAEAAGRRVGAIVQGIWQFVEKYKTPIIIAIGAIVAAFLTFKIISGASAFITALTSPIGLVVLAILAVAAAVLLVIHYWPEIRKAGENAWKGIQAVWNGAGKWFGARRDDIQNALGNVHIWIGHRFELARNNVQSAWNDVGSWFGNRRDDIQNAFSNVQSWFGNKFSQAKESATGAWNDAGSRFQGVWYSIQGAFSGVGWIGDRFRDAFNVAVAVWDTLPNRFWSIWNRAAAGVRGFLNDIIYPLNLMISGINDLQFNVPDWIPVIGGDHFGLSLNQIPYLAQGGIVSRATAFVAGEAGSEAVLPLQNNTGWMERVGDVVARKVSAMGTSGKLEAHIHLYLDGKEIYQTVQHYALRDARGANTPAFT